MRSEKDQMTVGKEKNVVEIKFRDIPREQDNTGCNPKQKEEKKEVFTKVGTRAFAMCPVVYAAWENRHGGGWEEGGMVSAPRTATRGGGGRSHCFSRLSAGPTTSYLSLFSTPRCLY